MPRPRPVLPMSIDEFEHMEHRLGWKHEYWDGAAQLSTQQTAVASFQRSIDTVPLTRMPLRDDEQLRLIQADDESALVELFVLTFDEAVEYAGWPDHIYRRDARDSLASFFGKTTEQRYYGSELGRPDASFVITSGEQPLAAVLVRTIRRGPILQPIMVHPAHQRRGLGTGLLSAALEALNAANETTLFSRCQLGNAASLAWHEKHGFEEIPNYFAATHRWRHFAWLSEHYTFRQQPDNAAKMQQLAEHWEGIAKRLEESNDRWSSGFLE
ncbi:MAG: N-acetyltransferase family protein [Planctomycetaceae bacterium]